MKALFRFALIFFFLLSTASYALRAQNNPCRVVAAINPGKDTIVSQSMIIYFTSVSTNATSFRFISNGIAYPVNMALNLTFTVGLHTLKLVAYNGSCTDTATIFIFRPGSQPTDRTNIKSFYGLPYVNQNATSLDAFPSGGYILSGSIQNNSFSQYPEKGLLIKIKESGCIEWTRFAQGIGFNPGKIVQAKVTTDGGIVITGLDQNQISYVIKLDAAGNAVWSKTYLSTDGTNKLHIWSMKAMDDGGMILIGAYSKAGGLAIVRIDASGNMLWNRLLDNQIFSSNWVISAVAQGNNLFVAGYLPKINNSITQSGSVVIKLDYSSGQVQWTRKYSVSTGEISIRDIHLVNGNELLINTIGSGMTGINPLNTFFFTDLSSGAVKRARRFVSGSIPMGVTSTSIVPLSNNKFYVLTTGTQILSLQPGFAHHSLVMKMDSDSTIQWVRRYGAYGKGRLFYATKGPQESFVALGDEGGESVPAYASASDKMMFRRIDSSGSTEAITCFMYDSPVKLEPIQIIELPFTWPVDVTLSLQSSPATVKLVSTQAQVRYDCPTFVDSCSFLAVTGKKSVCNLSDTYTYKLHRNKACEQPVQWSFGGGVNVVQQTDTSVTVKFPAFGTYKVVALLPFNCTPIADSILITAASSTPPLKLGPDTSICPNNIVRLRAGPGFNSYAWQDGSTDSVLAVSAAGKYWVRVIDSCNNILSDTLVVTLSQSVPISIGPDRTKCNTDTLHLSAPAGFMNYTWGNSYNLNTTTGQKVIVNPLVDTAYYVKAEKTAGCFAFDTVRISVFKSPPINLGVDTNFCVGDSAIFNAGPGFESYLWSTGQASQQIVVKVANQYSVIGTTVRGCKSYDTARVLSVYPSPVVSLDKNNALCAGTSRQLDGGNYVSYAWNTGATARTIAVNATGKYGVMVTDANGCQGSDSTVIKLIHPLPARFLPGDTALCSYGTLELKASQSFNRYLWSTGANNAFITIRQSGTYWLEATDANNCKGRDTVLVNAKDCMSGFYVPNAFTPNGDSKNDVFRPMLFGNVKQYRLTIFDRWGQVVFQTVDLQKGWDGKGAVPLPTGVFVWMCTYQLDGEAAKMQKGTVTLIR